MQWMVVTATNTMPSTPRCTLYTVQTVHIVHTSHQTGVGHGNGHGQHPNANVALQEVDDRLQVGDGVGPLLDLPGLQAGLFAPGDLLDLLDLLTSLLVKTHLC